MTSKIKAAIYPVADLIAAAVFLVLQPLLWIIRKAILRGIVLPRSQGVLDRADMALISHHYYSPVVFPNEITRPLSAIRKLPGVDLGIDRQLALVREFRYGDELRAIPLTKPDRLEYGYHNLAFEAGDGEMLYNIIRHFKPRRLVEIGCGQSTLMALKAERKNREEDPACVCEHTCIEPFEHDWLEQTGVKIIRSKVENLSEEIALSLERNDILFIDSSHVIRPQGDVLYEFQELLPILKPGVLVHVHDIFTPRDYLDSWVLGTRRLFNEQYLLETFLAFNSEFEVLVALNHLVHDYPDAMMEACPIQMQEPEHEPGSFWLRRK